MDSLAKKDLLHSEKSQWSPNRRHAGVLQFLQQKYHVMHCVARPRSEFSRLYSVLLHATLAVQRLGEGCAFYVDSLTAV